MRISTRQAEAGERRVPGRVEVYSTRFGSGRVVVRDGLPVEVTLPTASPVQPDRGAESGPWAALLERYFEGESVAFPLDVDAYAVGAGLSDFARDVLGALGRVPYGSVVSYRDLARDAGHPGAHRAVGSVMAGNRLPILLPCHRVVHSDGKVGRYGDGSQWKARLLQLEGLHIDEGRLE